MSAGDDGRRMAATVSAAVDESGIRCKTQTKTADIVPSKAGVASFSVIKEMGRG